MIIDKEYPATHSMSTSWFAIDVDGNVALIAFNDNGPLPDGLPDESLDEIVFVEPATIFDDFPTLPYTDEQAQAMLDSPYNVMSDKWSSGLYIIKPELVSQFIQKVSPSVSKQATPEVVRLSQNSHAFFINTTDEKLTPILDSLKQKDFFIGFIDIDMFIDDTYPNGHDNIVWEFNHPPLPYYVYGQPYSTWKLIEKIYKPSLPLKAEQLPPQMQRGALHLQMKFAETDKFQIADYCPFESMADKVTIVGGKKYHKLPNYRGYPMWFCSKNLPSSANMDCKECQKCKKEMWQNDPVSVAFSDYPTILFVTMPTKSNLKAYAARRGELLISESVVTPLIQGYSNMGIYDDKIAIKTVAQIFKMCKVHLEATIAELLPQVIIVEDNCAEILSNNYQWELHSLTVNGQSFPCYKASETEEHNETITELANLPFRGVPLFQPSYTNYELGTIVD